jgi:hypothetical protein
MQIAEQILLHTLNYIYTTIPVFIVSIFIMSLLTYSGYIHKISWIARPLMRFGHLHESLGISFITAFGSPSAASAMLRSLHENGLISRKEVIIAVLSNAFPVMIMESRTMLPVMISFLGRTGLIIFGIIITTRFVQTIAALAIGRFLFTEQESIIDKSMLTEAGFTGILLIKKSFSETLSLIKRIVKVTIPVTILIYTLIEAGVFNYIAIKIQFMSLMFKIPVEGLSIVAAYFGNYMAAYTVAGNLLNHGILTPHEIIITILTAKVIASIFFAVRHSTPYYIGIFGSGLGMRITVLNTLFRNLFDIGTIILFKLIV